MKEFKKVTKDNEHLKVIVKWQCFTGQAPYLSVTYELNKYASFSERGEISFGSDTELIAKEFPELKELVKYHLSSTDGPTHYLANSMYLASDRDCWGLKKGEKRQIRNGKTNQLCWELVAIKPDGTEPSIYDLKKFVDSDTKPDCDLKFEYRPWYRIGEGKTPDLEAARSCAIWPDAELSDFTNEKLEARLPQLMADFKAEVTKFLEWPTT